MSPLPLASFMKNSFQSWNAEHTFPFFATNETRETLDLTQLHMWQLYNWVGDYEASPGNKAIVSQFNYAYDWNQAFFFKSMAVEEPPSRVYPEDKTTWSQELAKLLPKLG